VGGGWWCGRGEVKVVEVVPLTDANAKSDDENDDDSDCKRRTE